MIEVVALRVEEGVDIPAISHAFILASSQNPRQFIQRRGPVLRKSPSKELAVIHDAIVVPVPTQNILGVFKASALLLSVRRAQKR